MTKAIVRLGLWCRDKEARRARANGGAGDCTQQKEMPEAGTERQALGSGAKSVDVA